MYDVPAQPLAGCEKVEMISVIRTMTVYGAGVHGDPVRYLYQYWSTDGELLAQHDTLEDVGNSCGNSNHK